MHQVEINCAINFRHFSEQKKRKKNERKEIKKKKFLSQIIIKLKFFNLHKFNTFKNFN